MKELYRALQKFRIDCPEIPKSKKAFNYNYAPLESIFPVINPILQANNLAFFQSVTFLKEVEGIETILCHFESGDTLTSFFPLPPLEYLSKTRKTKNKYTGNYEEIEFFVIKGFEDINANEAQAKGSLITYWRRYALETVLGIATGEDTDASGKSAPTTPKKQKSKDEDVRRWVNPKTITMQAQEMINQKVKMGGFDAYFNLNFKSNEENKALLKSKFEDLRRYVITDSIPILPIVQNAIKSNIEIKDFDKYFKADVKIKNAFIKLYNDELNNK